MTIQYAVKQARSWNQSMVLAIRLGGRPATVAAMRSRRNYYMNIARS